MATGSSTRNFDAILRVGGAFASTFNSVFSKTKTKLDATATAIKLVHQQQRTLNQQLAVMQAKGPAQVGAVTAAYAKLQTQLTSLIATQKKLQAQAASSAKNLARRASLQSAVAKGSLAVAAEAAPVAMSLRKSLAFNRENLQIGVTGEELGQNTAKGSAQSLGKALLNSSLENGASAFELQAGIGLLVAAGLKQADALKNLDVLGKGSVASGASVSDIAEVIFALSSNSGVASGADTAYGVNSFLAASKMGQVEFKEMAPLMPSLLAIADARGLKGNDAVNNMGPLLQMVRKTRATGGEAATSLQDFAMKLDAPAAIGAAKKNFGVDLNKLIEDEVKKSGENRLVAGFKVIDKLTGGDAQKLRRIIEDKESIMAALAFHKHSGQFFKERAIVRDRAQVSGLADKDAATMRDSPAQKLKEAQFAWERMGISLGTTLEPALTRVLNALSPVLEKFSVWSEKNPELTAALILGTVALTALATGLAVIGIGATYMVTGISAIGAAATGAWPLITGLATRFGVLSAAMWANPVGAVVLAIAGIGLAVYGVYKYWTPIKGFFASIWGSIKDGMEISFNFVIKKLLGISDGWTRFKAFMGFGGSDVPAMASAAPGAGVPRFQRLADTGAGAGRGGGGNDQRTQTINVYQKPGETGAAAGLRAAQAAARPVPSAPMFEGGW